MNPEARCSGEPVLLLKLTVEVIVSRCSRGVAATSAAQRRGRRACMIEGSRTAGMVFDSIENELLDVEGKDSYLAYLYTTRGRIYVLEKRRNERVDQRRSFLPTYAGRQWVSFGSFPHDPRFFVAMCPELPVEYWKHIGPQQRSKVHPDVE
jgi:hypothetical protein